MNVTEVRIKLIHNDKLRAFSSIALDGGFVVRDLKVLQGDGGLFEAMPSRLVTDRCTYCKAKNHVRAKYCNECGKRLGDNRAEKDSEGRAKLFVDIAHPINPACRKMIRDAVVGGYERELAASKEPGYVSRYDEF